MSILKIHIANYVKDPRSEAIVEEGSRILEGYFQDAINYGRQTVDDYFLITAQRNLNPNSGDVDSREYDVLLHVTPESYLHLYLNRGSRTDAAGLSNRTSDGSFSEIIWDYIAQASNPARAFANYGCHELMHNKAYSFCEYDSNRNNDFVHNQCGFGAFTRVVTPDVASTLRLNNLNIQKLSAVLLFKMKQNTRVLSRFERRANVKAGA